MLWSVAGQFIGKEEAVGHDPDASRSPVKEQGDEERAEPGQDRGRKAGEPAVIPEQRDGGEAEDEGEAVVDGHGAEKEALPPLKSKATDRAVAVQLEL